jgi:hypothetical protein
VISLDVVAASATLAAFCFFQVWSCFLSTNPDRLFHFGAPSVKVFAVLLADTTLLTGLIVAAWRMSGKIRRSRAGALIADVVFLLFFAIPANALWCVFQRATIFFHLESWRNANFQRFLRMPAWVGPLLVLAAVLYFHRQLARILYRLLIVLFPLVPFMTAQVVWILTRPPAMAKASVNAVNGPKYAGLPAGTHHPHRVVWIIFDELDYRLAFESPANAHLPEFNRLARQSLEASSAYPPGGRTMISVPALLSGRLITNTREAGISDLLVRYAGDTKATHWGTADTVFDVQREKGWRAGVAGWYLPYKRIFGADINAWEDQSRRLGLDPTRSFAGLIGDEFRVLGDSRARSLTGTSRIVLEHRRLVQEISAEAAHRAADPDLDLVFLHLPVPHFPFFYDARTGQTASEPRPAIAYLDHLQLGDLILGQIRQAMVESGVAGRTTLLVSSDHWNRESDLIDGRTDHRVPFLLHFPHTSGGLRYRAPFNTILSRRLVTAIMNGEVQNTDAAARWIDREKGGLVESPYNSN